MKCLPVMSVLCWLLATGCYTKPDLHPCGDGYFAARSCVELSGLVLSSGTLSPAFSPTTTEYVVSVGAASALRVTPTTEAAPATITVNGAPTISGSPSAIVAIGNAPTSTVTIDVTAGEESNRYVLTIVPTDLHYLKASNTDGGDQFGHSVSLSGDTLAVGAPGEDSGAIGVGGDQMNELAIDSGAVYIFTRSDGVWSQEAYLKASNSVAGNGFGYSVSVSGDTLAVGMPSWNGAMGRVVVFTRTSGLWSETAQLEASNGEAMDQFGYSVSLSGDTLAVGAPDEDSGATGVGGNQTDNTRDASGAVYIAARAGGGWNQEAYVKAVDTGVGDHFGRSVSLSGDALAVGAPDQNASNGAVYVLRRTSTWSHEAHLNASNPDTDDRFGTSVSLTGNTLAVGAPREDGSANSLLDSGAVYVFALDGEQWSQQAYLQASNAESGDHFGWSVSLNGETVAVGAHAESSGAINVGGDQADNSASTSGAVYVLSRDGGVWSQHAYLKASNTGTGDNFGHSVSLFRDSLAIGAVSEDSSATGVGGNQTSDTSPTSGAVYVY